MLNSESTKEPIEGLETVRPRRKKSERKKGEGTATSGKREYKKTVMLFIKMLVTIFFCEAAIMALLHILPLKNGWNIIADPFLLTVLGTPILYWLLFRPVWLSLEQRNCAVEALKANKAKLLETQTVAHIGNWSWDLQTNELLWAEEYYRMFGLSHQVFPSYEAFEKTIHPEDREFVNKSVEDTLKRKKPYDVEFRIILPGDIQRIVHVLGEVDYDKQDKPLRFFGTAQDITKRKNAEKALRKSEEKYRSIFETAANLITSVNEKGIIVECNNRTREVLGYERDEIIGQPISKIIHPDYLDKAQKGLNEILTKGYSYNNEYKMVRKDGTLIDISTNSSGLKDENGRYVRTICIIDDITERKKAEEDLLENRVKLKSLASQLSVIEDRERRRLATELHDQVGQSLVFSKTKLDILRSSLSSPELTEPLEEVCDYLGQVIRDTRTLTFDLSYPILYELGFEAAVAEWLEEKIQVKHGIETKFEDDGQTKPLSDDIRALLFRNVRELLINVVKHANAQNVKVSIRKVDSQIRVSVEDDGVGIDPAKVASLAGKNAGFGIFSIRERLELLGGHLEIESEPGRGSKITMTTQLSEK